MVEKLAIEAEFYQSWDKVENFYASFSSADWPMTPAVRQLIRAMRQKGFDTVLRAGQSMYNLVLSRAVEHGEIKGSSIVFEFSRNGMLVHFGKEQRQYAAIEFNASVEYMLSTLAEEVLTTLEFYSLPPSNIRQPTLISGNDSEQLPLQTYLYFQQGFNEPLVFEFRNEFDCSPFKQAELLNDAIAIGLHSCFYLYSLKQEKLLLKLPCDGYFGSFIHKQGCFYICDASGITCVSNNGERLWRSSSLGVDGVLISSISAGTITGSGEWDPPGGWRSFTIDAETGKILAPE